MNQSVAFQAVRLTLLFLEREDRLLLLAANRDGAQEGMVLTRRLTARLINGLATLLKRSNVVASTAPEELKDDIVLMEHQGAIAAGEPGTGRGSAKPQGQSGAEAATNLRVPQRLVETINIQTNPDNFHIVLEAAGGFSIATTVNRIDLHRIVELLKRQADTAGWNLQIDAVWLGDDHSQITLN